MIPLSTNSNPNHKSMLHALQTNLKVDTLLIQSYINWESGLIQMRSQAILFSRFVSDHKIHDRVCLQKQTR